MFSRHISGEVSRVFRLQVWRRCSSGGMKAPEQSAFVISAHHSAENQRFVILALNEKKSKLFLILFPFFFHPSIRMNDLFISFRFAYSSRFHMINTLPRHSFHFLHKTEKKEYAYAPPAFFRVWQEGFPTAASKINFGIIVSS